MRFAVLLLASVAAFLIWNRFTHPPKPYAVVVAIDRRQPLRVEVYEKVRPPPPFKPGPRIMDMGISNDVR